MTKILAIALLCCSALTSVSAQQSPSPLANSNEIRPGVLRTPDARFENLEDYPFSPNYLEIRVRRGVGGQEDSPMRIHYVDEGSGETLLLLHGQPTWSYLYRNMIPLLAENHRVIAPDWIGFGKSDKFIREQDYSLRMHLDTAIAVVESLDLRDVTLVMQDWGGFLGMPLAMQLPDRFARLVLMNTALPTGYGMMTPGWYGYRDRTRMQSANNAPRTFSAGNSGRENGEIVRGYSAPFPDPSYYAGPNTFPQIVPILPSDPAAQLMIDTANKLHQWSKPALVMFSDGDQVLGPHQNYLRRLIPSAMEEPLIVIENAGHFLQEDQPEAVSEQILRFIERHPLP